jgi:rare lipoprotein A
MKSLRHLKFTALLAAALLLAGCAGLRAPGGDGPAVVEPQPAPPPAVATVPPPPPAPVPSSNAVPRVERITRGAPNSPYDVNGQRYDPENADVPIVQRGVASWYGKPFHGRRTASGEVYDMHAMTTAGHSSRAASST